MQILVISATELEIKPLLDELADTNSPAGRDKPATLITGIGGVATTYALTDYCRKNAADIIIQAGIAGGFSRGDAGKVYAIKEEIFGDLGVWEKKKFNTIFDLKLSGKNDFPFKKGLLMNPCKTLLSVAALKMARGITVNEITTDKKRIVWYKQNLSPLVETMEGAAFHYVCLQQKIPFIQLRAISNYAGERNKAKWKIKKAVQNLNAKLILLLSELSTHHETDFRI
jgi:futalosine hydrolase